MTVEPRIPEPEGPNAEFYAHAAGGTLHLQRCADCGTYRHPPRLRCASCGSGASEWVASPGRGKLWSWTVSHVAFDRRWKDEIPYATGVIELDEGVRLIGALEDVEDPELDERLEVTLQPHSEQFSFLILRRPA